MLLIRSETRLGQARRIRPSHWRWRGTEPAGLAIAPEPVGLPEGFLNACPCARRLRRRTCR